MAEVVRTIEGEVQDIKERIGSSGDSVVEVHLQASSGPEKCLAIETGRRDANWTVGSWDDGRSCPEPAGMARSAARPRTTRMAVSARV